MHFCYRRTIRLEQENFSCNNKTSYTIRHKFLVITHKNNSCQLFSRSSECKESQFFSLPFGQAVASIYYPTSNFN